MSQTDDSCDTSDPSDQSLTRTGTWHDGFCPAAGLMAKGSTGYQRELGALLHTRLRAAAGVLAIGFAIFFVRNIVLGLMSSTPTMVFHLIVTLVLTTITGLLFYKPSLAVRPLRWLELATFGFPVAFFAWSQFCITCHAAANDQSLGYQVLLLTSLPWMLLIQTYGVFIPNTWRRAAAVVGAMAVFPLVGIGSAATKHESVHAAAIENREIGRVGIALGLSGFISVFGTYGLGHLRRAAYNARQLGSYVLKERLGSGGMGDVFLGEHRLLKRPCAIKLIRSEKSDDTVALDRFAKEVQAAAALTHPNTIEIYDYGQAEDGTFYYAMEYLPGMDLQEMVQKYGPLNPERTVHLMLQVCSALHEAHGVGLVHRDIKPGNIFVSERGGIHDFAKLLDFGLVKQLSFGAESMEQTMEGVIIGSPLYAPPEAAIHGAIDTRGDIYSLGATMYYLLSGEPVFDGENPISVLFAHANEEPRPLCSLDAGIPSDLAEVVMTCLRKDPEDRFATIAEVESALRGCTSAGHWSSVLARQWWDTQKSAGFGAGDEARLSETLVMDTTA